MEEELDEELEKEVEKEEEFRGPAMDAIHTHGACCGAGLVGRGGWFAVDPRRATGPARRERFEVTRGLSANSPA